MDNQIEHYQKLLTGFLEEYAAAYNKNTTGAQAQVLYDYQRNHFQLLRTGWRGKDYRFGVIFHFDIREGKIWVQENRTDILIAEELVARGVPKTDIVLGLQPAEDRPYTARRAGASGWALWSRATSASSTSPRKPLSAWPPRPKTWTSSMIGCTGPILNCCPADFSPSKSTTEIVIYSVIPTFAG